MFRTEVGGEFAAPPTFWLGGPMGDKLKKPIIRKLA